MVMSLHLLAAADLAATPPAASGAAGIPWLAATTAAVMAVARLSRDAAKASLIHSVRALWRGPAPAWESPSATGKPIFGARLDQKEARCQITRWLLRLAAFAFGLGVAFPTLAQTITGSSLNITGQSTLQGEVVICSGRPWIDVRCNGAIGDGSHDDTTAINTAISTAITNNWPVHLAAGTYKVSSQITIDYAGQASKGFRLISEAAVIDGRTIAAGPVLKIQCSGRHDR
jgi:hypothetical protein